MTRCSYCDTPEHPGQNCDRESLKLANARLREDLRVRTLELQATHKLDGKGVIMISSLVSHRTQKPRVDIQIGELHTQMSVDAAIDVARNLFEVCAGAYADGFIFNYLTEKLDQPKENAAAIIEDFRGYRADLAAEFKKDQEEA